MSQQQDKIIEFQGPYRFLSNFWPATFVWDGIFWSCSENAYVAAKTLDRATRLQISKIANPGAAKRFGRKMKLRDDWDQVKFGLMEEIVRAKFSQNPGLAKQLVDTGDAVLDEGNTWNDRIWGISPPGSGNGENWLGRILMKIRDELKGK